MYEKLAEMYMICHTLTSFSSTCQVALSQVPLPTLIRDTDVIVKVGSI